MVTIILRMPYEVFWCSLSILSRNCVVSLFVPFNFHCVINEIPRKVQVPKMEVFDRKKRCFFFLRLPFAEVKRMLKQPKTSVPYTERVVTERTE